MYKEKSVIAIIPARSGSKGLPNKNIKELAGKPLLAYSIEAAQKSGVFDEIFVSTDSQHYADIAVKWGASVPFLRDAELASDTASSWDVVLSSLQQYRNMGKEFDAAALLQPTSPLRSAEDILAGIKQMERQRANVVVAVCEVEHSPLWANTLPEDGSMTSFIRPKANNQPRQALDQYYRVNGALYIVNVDYLQTASSIYDSNCYAYIMPKERSVDIDDLLDFEWAEFLMLRKAYV